MRMRFFALAFAAAVLAAPAHAADFSDWAAIVVAGDWHAHDGQPSEVFDNARRDLARELVGIGFKPGNIEQFSVRPERYPGQGVQPSTPQSISTALWDLSNRTSGGCLAYFTSHGSPDGIVMGSGMISPDQMSNIIGDACGGRPTVVIVSACFSGVFVPVLQAPDRMVFTAARADRTSFGCGQSDKYTFFDTCTVSLLPNAGDFPDFAKEVDECVAAREKKEGVDLPSDPQLALGKDAAAELPRWR